MSTYLVIFLIIALGYILGSIQVKGVSLGTSGILLVALVMGHFGYEVPAVVRNFGLVCFVTSVGIIAGPVFFENFKKKALNYVVLGILTILTGAVVCVVFIKAIGIPTALSVGLLNGALTSTPGLAAALEATNDPITSVGYGIAYPFGVLGVVLFVQLVPRIFKTDIKTEMTAMEKKTNSTDVIAGKMFSLEPLGFFPIALAAATGVIIGGVSIPLPGASFSLGTSGGPLLTGLLVGHFGHIGPVNITPKKSTMEAVRELGLALFLLGAGTDAGKGFVEVLKEYGFSLFFAGVAMTLIPMMLAFFVAVKMMKLGTMNTLGSICGGMTSTPALGSLIAVARSDAVAAAYAATYPIALVCVVILSQCIAALC